MMVMFGIILLIVILALGVAVSRAPPTPRADPPVDPVDDELSPTELAATDPLAALIRYGTPDDAARLGEQGVDLGQLGYRPPADE